MKKLLFFIVCIFCNASWAQITVETISVKEDFPEVSLKITDRNPKQKAATDFTVLETGGSIGFQLQNLGNLHSNDKVQNILILVENLNHPDRLQFYKQTLKNAINSLKTEHYNINIAMFDRVRNQGTQSVFPLLKSFTSNKSELLNAIEGIQPKNDIFGNNKSSDLYLAIFEGLELLNNKFTQNQTLFVLSTAFNNKWSSHTSSESAKAFAEKNNITVHSLQYRIQGFEHHKLTDLVAVNYGNEIITNNELKAQNFIINTISSITNNLGKQYIISYTSNHNENGEIYTDSLQISGTSYSYSVKTNNKLALLYYCLAGLLLALLLLFIVLKIRRNKQQNRVELVALENQVQTEKNKSLSIDRDLTMQKEALQKINRTKEEELLDKKLEAQEEEIYKQMKLLGALPILQFTTSISKNKLVSFTIEKSRISIGRSVANDVVLSSPTVSRDHAEIFFKENVYYIKDLNATAGTFLNGEKITETQLKHGNIIKLGKVEITFIL